MRVTLAIVHTVAVSLDVYVQVCDFCMICVSIKRICGLAILHMASGVSVSVSLSSVCRLLETNEWR